MLIVLEPARIIAPWVNRISILQCSGTIPANRMKPKGNRLTPNTQNERGGFLWVVPFAV